jgi:hypothetical protein
VTCARAIDDQLGMNGLAARGPKDVLIVAAADKFGSYGRGRVVGWRRHTSNLGNIAPAVSLAEATGTDGSAKPPKSFKA